MAIEKNLLIVSSSCRLAIRQGNQPNGIMFSRMFKYLKFKCVNTLNIYFV